MIIYVLIGLTYLFGFFAAIFGLLFGVSFSESQQEKYPILKKFSRKLLFVTFCISSLLSAGAGIYKEILSVKSPVIELIQGPSGELTQKATTTGFKRELEEAAIERVREAEDYFNIAERDFAKKCYQDAINTYQKSINAVPTMSGYLNLGVSFLYVSEFKKAEDVLISGVQIARKKGNKKFEGAFLDNIGSAYFMQGKLEEALNSCHAALEIDKQIGNPLGQAIGLNNLGLIYRNQGDLKDALTSHLMALETHKQIGNPLGQANTFNNIGNVYASQGKLEDALTSHLAALEIHKQIGNPLGQADAFANIGKVYASQGKKYDALEFLENACTIYQKIGIATKLQDVEELIEQLNAM